MLRTAGDISNFNDIFSAIYQYRKFAIPTDSTFGQCLIYFWGVQIILSVLTSCLCPHITIQYHYYTELKKNNKETKKKTLSCHDLLTLCYRAAAVPRNWGFGRGTYTGIWVEYPTPTPRASPIKVLSIWMTIICEQSNRPHSLIHAVTRLATGNCQPWS